jgi:hypothetical protein
LEHEPKLGLAFVVATGLLLAVGAAVVLFPATARAAHAGARLFAGLIAVYVAATIAGIPLLSPSRSPSTTWLFATKTVESAGLVFA